MQIDRYEKGVRSTDQTSGKDGHRVRIFGLAGEIGSLLTELKKDIREGSASANTAVRVAEELGDILWYVTALALHGDHRLRRNVLYHNLVKIHNRHSKQGKSTVPVRTRALRADGAVATALDEQGIRVLDTFSTYQELAVKTSRYRRRESLAPYIARIWSHSAELLEGIEERTPSSEIVKGEKLTDVLGDLTWYVANVASTYDLNLDTIAAENLTKVQSRWPAGLRKPTPLFDRGAPRLEKFPRRFDVRVLPKGHGTSIMMINDVVVGDPLTDNSWEPDGYRFHDVLHLAHAAILGWSPVLRRMLNRKRKYDRRIDEIEDGARAAIVEEAITKLVHSYAQSVDPINLLDNQDAVSFDILKQVKLLTSGLEVDKCKYWEWEEAILAGHKTFNRLRRRERGTIKIDLYARSIKFISR